MLQESRYIQWNQEVRENWVRIWQLNCLGETGFCAPIDRNKEQFNAVNGRSLIQILFFWAATTFSIWGLRRRMQEYGRMRM